VCCSVLQCVAVCCSVLQCVAVCCSVLQCDAVCCKVLQRVAVCCNMLQCVAVCCSVLHQKMEARFSQPKHVLCVRVIVNTIYPSFDTIQVSFCSMCKSNDGICGNFDRIQSTIRLHVPSFVKAQGSFAQKEDSLHRISGSFDRHRSLFIGCRLLFIEYGAICIECM